MLLDTLKLSSETFWLALKYTFQNSNVFDPKCDHLYHNLTSQQIINKTCPDILFMPARTLAFDALPRGRFNKYIREWMNSSMDEKRKSYLDRLSNLLNKEH